MKFRLFLSPNNEAIPFNYAHQLCGIFHRWLGPNELHNMLSLYSLGWLQGEVKVQKNGLFFPHGAHWDIGIYDDEIAERLIRGILLKKIGFYGMDIRKADRLQPPAFAQKEHRFLAGSPILLRKVEKDGSRTHVTYEEKESGDILKRVLLKKAEEAELASAKQLKIQFDRSYPNPKTKLVDIKGIKNRASVCPILAEGAPEALEFLWTVGAGELTGVGFGSLNHTADFRNGS